MGINSAWNQSLENSIGFAPCQICPKVNTENEMKREKNQDKVGEKHLTLPDKKMHHRSARLTSVQTQNTRN